MANKIRFRAIRSVAVTEWVKWITNPRIVVLGILMVFVRSFCVQPMLTHAEKYGGPLNAAEPFLAVCNSGMLTLLIPIVYILLICDFPLMGGNTLFFIHRTGKLNWFLGQLLFIAGSIVTFLLVLFAGCALMSRGIFGTAWSDTVTKYNAAFPDEAKGFVSRLLPPNLYNQLTLPEALLKAFLLMALNLLLLALILCTMKMLYLRAAGLFSALALTAAGIAVCSLKNAAMWLFPAANTMIWLHYQEILKKQIVPVAYSYLYFAVLIAALLTADFLILRRLQFINIEQEGT
ncbi:MAG: hypothetical protein IKH27_09600 [Oscillospiraceae bacterium]|nr:hypothetical protein [Oscillospiraceae bacterium]